MVEEASNSSMTPAIRSLLSTAHSSAEVLVGLLQILMAECGLYLADKMGREIPEVGNNFRSEQFFDSRIVKELKLDFSKNSDGVYTNKYLLRGFSEPSIELLCDPHNHNVLVTAIISSFKCVFSVVLKTQNYVIETSKNNYILLNMKSLSIRFKNAIAVPVRASILNKHGFPNPSLEGLPDELLHHIWKKIPQPEFLPPLPGVSAVFTAD